MTLAVTIASVLILTTIGALFCRWETSRPAAGRHARELPAAAGKHAPSGWTAMPDPARAAAAAALQQRTRPSPGTLERVRDALLDLPPAPPAVLSAAPSGGGEPAGGARCPGSRAAATRALTARWVPAAVRRRMRRRRREARFS